VKKLGRNIEKHGSKPTATANEQQHISQQPFYHGFRVPTLLNMDSPSQQLVREAEVNEPLPFGPFGTFPDGHNSTDPNWKPGMNYSFMPAVMANSNGTMVHDNTSPYGADASNNNFITDINDPMFPNAAIVLGRATNSSDHTDDSSGNRATRPTNNRGPTPGNTASSAPSTAATSSRITAMNLCNISTASRDTATHSGNPTITSSNIIHDTHSQIAISPSKTETFQLLNSIRSSVQNHAYRISTSDTDIRAPRIIAELSKLLDTADEVEKQLQEIYKQTEEN
jgi:hypothetical protein